MLIRPLFPSMMISETKLSNPKHFLRCRFLSGRKINNGNRSPAKRIGGWAAVGRPPPRSIV